MKVLHTLLLALVFAAGCSSSSTSPSVTAIDTFASRIQEHGFAWRSFTVTTGGTVTVQLVSLSQADAVVRLGVGTIDGTNCVFTTSVDAPANSAANSPQITTTLNQGTYCVEIADIGNLTQLVDFSITITKPF